jgi:hypothetical protein
MQQFTLTRGATRAPEPTVGPWLASDLDEQIERLRKEPYWQSARNSKTIVRYADFRVGATAILANTTIHEYRTAGRLAVKIVHGHFRMHADGKEIHWPTGITANGCSSFTSQKRLSTTEF